MISMAGVVGVILPLLGYAIREVREVETIMPDYDGAVIEASS